VTPWRRDAGRWTALAGTLALPIELARTELAYGAWLRRDRPQTRPGHAAAAHPQERQVARLASQGLRNREIAEQLFLSPHTVGYHLRKVYAKPGISSRAELHQLDLHNDTSH
jgi:DNA-binding CsgD family transcriptional regulator